MNRRILGRIAIGVGVLVAVLVAALALFAATFDVNRFKPQIVAAVQERTGRTLAFDGELALSVFPRIAVRLPPTTLSEHGSSQVAARLRSGSARLALWPLLRGQVNVDSVRIEGLQATVVRSKDGRTNFDDLLKRDAPAGAPAKQPTPPSAGAAASIGKIELADADLTLRDRGVDRVIRLTGLDLAVGRIAPSARTPLSARAAVTVDKPALEMRVESEGELEWDATGALAGVHGAVAKAEGKWQQRQIAVNARADRLIVGSQALEVRSLKASLKGSLPDPLTAEMNVPRLEAGRDKASGERIELSLQRGGPAPIEAKAVIEGVHGNAARIEAKSLRVTASLRAGARLTRLDASAPVLVSLDQKTVRVDGASGEAVIEDPAYGKEALRVPFSAALAVDVARQTAGLQLDARADALKGRAKVDANGFDAPRIGFDVDAERIDLDRLAGVRAPAPSAPAGAAGAPEKGAAPGDAKIDWAALRGVNAGGKLHVAALRVRGVDVNELRADVKAADGRVELAPVALRVYGGAVQSRVSLDAKAQRAVASGSASGVDLKRAVGTVGGRMAIEGRSNGSFELAGTGASVAQIKRSLGGRLAVDVSDGALVGIDLADLIGTAANLLQGRGRETGALDQSRRTPFSQLSASAQIVQGVASSDDLKARSPQLELTGRGRLDIATSELDYTMRAQVLAVPATERSALRSLAGVTVPVHISGPLEHPAYAVDWTAVAAEALLRRATGRAGAPAANELLQGLGDLLGRRRK